MCDTVTSCESHKDQAKRTIGLLSQQSRARANKPIITLIVMMGVSSLVGAHVYTRGEPNSHPAGPPAYRMVYAAKVLLFALDCSDEKRGQDRRQSTKCPRSQKNVAGSEYIMTDIRMSRPNIE